MYNFLKGEINSGLLIQFKKILETAATARRLGFSL
jgi:hypothetical protein